MISTIRLAKNFHIEASDNIYKIPIFWVLMGLTNDKHHKTN